MTALTTGQYLPGNSILHRLDARSKFFGFLLLIACIVLTNSLWGYVLMIGFTAFIIILSKFSLNIAVGSIQRLLCFFTIVFCLNAVFFNSDNPIFHWWIFTLSWDGIIQGANIVFRIILIIILANILTLTTPPLGLMTAIETLISPLRFVRIPVEDVAMILSVAIQFIPTLLEETDTIKKAQIARGAQFESKKIHERARAMLPLVVPIFMSAFKRADELSMAMEARGYRDAKHRTKKARTFIKFRDWITLIACALLCIVQIVLF